MLLRSGRAVAIAALLAAAPAGAATLAIMPVKHLDTSGEARDQTADHTRRLAEAASALAADLAGSGRFDATVLVLAEPLRERCPQETPRCLVDAAREAGGDEALFMVVQKTSMLISQVFVQILDLRTETVVMRRELNFRGDDDEAWRRMERFLARELAAAR